MTITTPGQLFGTGITLLQLLSSAYYVSFLIHPEAFIGVL